MNKILKRVLLGVVIWLIPFLVSFLVWDVEAGGPSVSMGWFNAIMAFSWAVGFSIAAVCYFGKVRKTDCKDGFVTGLTWYVVLILLDYVVLVKSFGMFMVDYYPMLLTYLNTLVLATVIGRLKK